MHPRLQSKHTTFPPSPRQRWGELFVAGQLAHATLDNKTFADASARMSDSAIREAYRSARQLPDFAYTSFVETYFELPSYLEDRTPREAKGERDNIRDHITQTWTALTRTTTATEPGSSLLALPHPYVVPGGRFRELYYWDSYFTLVGLAEDGRIDLVEYMVENFAYLIRTYGFIPNGTRSYFFTRSNPPFFALMVRLLADIQGPDILTRYLSELEIEYAYWMRGAAHIEASDSLAAFEHVVRLPSGVLLNRYWDSSDLPREEMLADDVGNHPTHADRDTQYREVRAVAESGWDFSTRWRTHEDQHQHMCTTSMIPIDLNSLMVLYERTLADAYDAHGDSARSTQYRNCATERNHALVSLCWNDEHGWCVDYNFVDETRSQALTLAGLYPLWAGLVSNEQALRMEQTLRTSFLREGGLVTSLRTSGEQWDAPNGWAPLQFLAIEGLERYGFNAFAEDIAQRWAMTCFRMFKRFGALMEKYNVEYPGEVAGGGEYAVQDGFGWTNAVLLVLMNRYGIEYDVDTV